MTTRSNKLRILMNRFSQPRTQASLFHYIKEQSDESIWEDIDWSFLTHPIRTAKDAWTRPRAKPSLFHYIESEPVEPFSWKEFIRDLFTGFKSPVFIPSVYADPEGLMAEQVRWRVRQVKIFFLIIAIFIFGPPITLLLIGFNDQSPPQQENIVFIDSPIYVPFEGDDRQGGGGGGGGREEQLQPMEGRMPEPVAAEMIIPDPENPQPLLPTDDLLAQVLVELPIDIPVDTSLSIGDVTAPPNSSTSFGSGSGGGIGTGTGRGVGSGDGSGAGTGSGGGWGSGSGGGIGSGEGPWVMGKVEKDPVLLRQVDPPYTEEGRKARAEGIVVLRAIIRKDGSVDNFKVVRSLGYGLDESAIRTIASKWRFQPATYKGKNVDCPVDIEVVFNIY